MPEPANVYDMARAQQLRAAGQAEPGQEPALWKDSDTWTERAIQVRPWIVPRYLMRGAVTLVAGPGGAGKSTLMNAWCCALALGQAYGGFEPASEFVVMNYNVEDDLEEQRRRLSASLRSFNAEPRHVAQRIIRCGPNGVGTLLERDLLQGTMANTAAFVALEAMIEAEKPDVVMLDPLVELHTADENDNTALRMVIAHMRSIARRHNIAVVIIHHMRKGAIAGEADGIRGGGAIVGAVRAAYTVMPMTEAEAEELGLPDSQRASLFRVDSAKGNYAPPRAAAWHELQEYHLDNGETIAAAICWEPPAVRGGPAPEDMARIVTALEKGSQGQPFSARLALDQPRSVGALLASLGYQGKVAQQRVLKALYAEGWSVQQFRDANRMVRGGLRSKAGLPRATWLGEEGKLDL